MAPNPEPSQIPRPPDSREKILEVAEGLFARAGYSGVGMRELAATVGLSKSSLFHHFPSKLDLYAAVLDGVLARIELGLVDAVDQEASPEVLLERWIDSVICTLSEDIPAGRLMMRALVDEEPFPAIEIGANLELDRALMPYEVRLATIIDRISTVLSAGVASGAFRPVSVGDTLLSVIGTIVFHFASGDLGAALLGEPVFSQAAVSRRRREVSEFIRRGLLA